MLDLNEICTPLNPENLAGDNLEYSPLYMELEGLASKTPDSQVGDSKIDGKEPNWRQLEKNCLELCKTTRDLRVASYLTVAQTELYGLQGLSNGLKLVLYLVGQMWTEFYPRLSAEDDNDPVERLNILAMLSPEPGTFNDPIMFLSRLRNVRLAPSLPYTMRDFMIANGEIESAALVVDLKLIGAEMMGVPLSDLEAQLECVTCSLRSIDSLCSDMNTKMQENYSISMVGLQKELARFATFYSKHLEAFNVPVASGENVIQDDVTTNLNTKSPHTSSGGMVSFSSLKASNRAEALLFLRRGAEYFQTEEPTSPVPFFINRALRLAEMNFMDLLADIAPDALPYGRQILGVKQTDET